MEIFRALHALEVLWGSGHHCVLPLDRLEELEATREIGSSAPLHYSFMGYLLKPAEFLQISIPKMIERMGSDGLDVTLLVPA